jgi:hypothetical protein
MGVSEVVRFGLSTGGYLLVEVDEDIGGVSRAARGPRPPDMVTTATQTLREAFGQVRAAAEDAIGSFAEMLPAPHELSIEFGVRLSAEAGVVVAKAGGEANFTVRLCWTRPPP